MASQVSSSLPKSQDPSDLPLPPGPKGFREIFRLIGQRRRSPQELYQELQSRYGDLVYFRVGRLETILVHDLNAIQTLLQTQAKSYHKGPGYERLRTLIGNGLLTSEGAHWRQQRKLAAPAFHAQQIAKSLTQIAPAIQDRVNRWKIGDTLDLVREMNEIALEIVQGTLIGSDVQVDAEKVRRAVSETLRFADESGTNALRILDAFLPSRDGNLAFRLERHLPLPRVWRFKKSLSHLRSIVDSLIESRRTRGPASYGDDLLGALMSSHDEEDQTRMSDAQLRDEVMTLFLAGHETTATALTWTWLMLDRNPKEATRVYQEVEAFWSTQGEKSLELEDLARLPETLHFFEETLRLYPPFWRITRTSLLDQVLSGYRIPKGATLLISPLSCQQDARVWKDPKDFRPSRFEGSEKATRHRFAFLSFGGGARSCIGSNFAIMEALLILVTALRRVRMRVIPQGEIPTELTITLKPKNGLPARVEGVCK